MAKAINVLLDIGSKQYDLNKMGLLSMNFNRFLGSTKGMATGVLSDIEITMFDKTGSELLAILQSKQNTVKIIYGFEDNLSQVYTLNFLKYKATYNNLGSMISIGAIGSQLNRKYNSELYPAGTKVEDIVRNLARRNNWHIGSTNSKEYINIGELVLPRALHKKQDETDFSFIQNQLLPVANKSAFNVLDNGLTNYWDFQLIPDASGQLCLFFREYTNRGVERRLWKYSYGTSKDNAIISLTNSIDYSFLVNGLSIQVAVTATDLSIPTDEENQSKIESIIKNNKEEISKHIEQNGLPYMNPNNFVWNVELIHGEDVGNQTFKDAVLNAIQKVMNSINTIELEIIGNPKIMPTDLIELDIRNKDGSVNILSSNSAVGSYWRIVGIRESVGLDGYVTKLGLVREQIK